MHTSGATNNGALGVPIPLKDNGGIFESSSKKVLPTPPLLATTQTEVSRIILDVRQALHSEELSGAKDQAREFQERMELFIQGVERVREGLGYDWMDYMKRLSVNGSVVKEIFERILAENEGLRKTYEGVMEGFSGDKEKLKEKILRKFGEDLVYEGMKREEYKNTIIGVLDFTGKSVKEVRGIVIEYAKAGGKGLDLSFKSLNKVFVGEPELFRDMVVGFARNGGKGLDLEGNWFAEIFAGKPEVFRDMMVGFAKAGGKFLDLSVNKLGVIFAGKPKLFKKVVVEFARNGGKGLDLGGNQLYEAFTEEPELFKEMVVEFTKNGGKGLEFAGNGLVEILKSSNNRVGHDSMTVREYIQEVGNTYGARIMF